MITANLQLPYLAPSQAQKHLTHNEALRMLDALVQAAVSSRGMTTPPVPPVEGQSYLVAAPAAGAWTGMADRLAAYQDGAWRFFAPRSGWRVWVADEDRLCIFDGTGWKALPGSERVERLGIGATADLVNRLTVSSDASLLDHAGHGHQLKVNKAGAADTASLLFQSNYSGRAEIGLPAGGDFAVKVSPDGVTWQTALTIDSETGAVGLPRGLAAPLALSQGGTGAATGLGALDAMGLRYSLPTLANNTVAEVNFGGAIYGSVIFLVGNTTSVPVGSVFARMAPGPQLVPLGMSGGALGIYSTALSGTTGTAGQVNMAALDGGRLQIENRRGFAVSYVLYLLR